MPQALGALITCRHGGIAIDMFKDDGSGWERVEVPIGGTWRMGAIDQDAYAYEIRLVVIDRKLGPTE